MSAPTVEEVDRITGIADPILRNLRITHCYHEMSHAVARMIGPGANWCAFATWASKQAGQSIRQEDLVRTIEDEIRRSPEFAACLECALACVGRLRRGEGDLLSEALLAALDVPGTVERVADAVARGNQKVFEEIGREFARFVAAFERDTVFDAEKIERFCAELRPGEPPEGQQLLREAFLVYGEARFREDPREKAERLFYGNLLIGFHEQTRLQPEIAEALNAWFGSAGQTRRRLLGVLFPGFWLRIRYRLSRLLGRTLPLDAALDALIGHAMEKARLAITHCLMTLRLPGAEASVAATRDFREAKTLDVLRLGTNLPDGFPGALLRITHPKLAELLSRIDATPNSVVESGARDWADFRDRMHFITDLFRTHHERPSLFGAPFTADQVAAFKAGRMPEGRL